MPYYKIKKRFETVRPVLSFKNLLLFLFVIELAIILFVLLYKAVSSLFAFPDVMGSINEYFDEIAKSLKSLFDILWGEANSGSGGGASDIPDVGSVSKTSVSKTGILSSAAWLFKGLGNITYYGCAYVTGLFAYVAGLIIQWAVTHPLQFVSGVALYRFTGFMRRRFVNPVLQYFGLRFFRRERQSAKILDYLRQKYLILTECFSTKDTTVYILSSLARPEIAFFAILVWNNNEVSFYLYEIFNWTTVAIVEAINSEVNLYLEWARNSGFIKPTSYTHYKLEGLEEVVQMTGVKDGQVAPLPPQNGGDTGIWGNVALGLVFGLSVVVVLGLGFAVANGNIDIPTISLDTNGIKVPDAPSHSISNTKLPDVPTPNK